MAGPETNQSALGANRLSTAAAGTWRGVRGASYARRARALLARASQHWWTVALVGAALVVGICQLATRAPGFPLDDAWIHQDFARTLATTGRFAYLPGHAGAGSTSPLWVLLLLPPQLLAHGVPPLWLLTAWVSLLGIGTLGGLAIVTGIAAADLAWSAGGSPRVVSLARWLACGGALTEWHLVWAAASGMETDLFALLVLGLFVAAARGARPLPLGLLGGAAVAVRPEGLAAVAVVALVAVWGARMQREAVGETVRGLKVWARAWGAPFAAGALVLLAPYGLLNVAASGSVLPSTLAAKAAYYGPNDLVRGVGAYAWQVVTVLLVSSPMVVVPALLSCSQRLRARADHGDRGGQGGGQGGFALATMPSTGSGAGGPRSVGPSAATAMAAGRARTSPAPAKAGGRVTISLRMALWLWCAVLVLGYAGRVTELLAHGRYLMPILPPLLALGAAGATPVLLDPRRRALALAGGLILAGASVVSLGRGAQIFAENVHFINGIQVDTALWVRGHVPPGAVVATHDIGAIGYFGGHPVLDMAGLADPSVVPYLSDQPGLERYLARHHAAYVAMFTDWFPPPAILAHDLAGRVVYRSRGNATFVVYRTGW